MRALFSNLINNQSGVTAIEYALIAALIAVAAIAAFTLVGTNLSTTFSTIAGMRRLRLIPRLRRYARAIARDPVAADDLVQDCLVRALGKIHLWKKGTDLRAWLFTILHNQYVSLARQAARQRDRIELLDQI